MKCSVELPVYNLKYSDKFDYDFVIASTCVESSDYYEFYQNRDQGRFMILDNGAFETGAPMDEEQYLEIANYLQPDVLVIPDIPWDPAATLDRFFSFMNSWKNRHEHYLLSPPIQNTKLMGVIQANGNFDTAHMMAMVYNSHGIDWIGIPYIAMIDRYKFVKQHPELLNIHILGCPSLPEVLALNEFENIKSIDSSLPVKLTKEDKRINKYYTANSYVKPGDKTLDLELLSYNLELFTAICHGECVIVRK